MKSENWNDRLKKIFGSETKVAEILAINPQAVNNWKRRKNRVPYIYHKALISEAEKLGYKLTSQQLIRGINEQKQRTTARRANNA